MRWRLIERLYIPRAETGVAGEGQCFTDVARRCAGGAAHHFRHDAIMRRREHAIMIEAGKQCRLVYPPPVNIARMPRRHPPARRKAYPSRWR